MALGHTFGHKRKLYYFLKKNGQIFSNSSVVMVQADGLVQKKKKPEIIITMLDIGVKGKVVPIKLIVLKTAQNSSRCRFFEKQESSCPVSPRFQF
ncbi:hypothetical protein CEXT_448461 [Caerostris extrusa]|uniref:Ribosomal protein L14 n=1 Tax=Caerostris extrusa TaxID=172846 RepID=A0AAV4R4F7_CAEEX|nr:hypothetical protein CEXT_448461 [Caerostris extrusa]